LNIGLFSIDVRDLKPAHVDQNMPKPTSPERPPVKRRTKVVKVDAKTVDAKTVNATKVDDKKVNATKVDAEPLKTVFDQTSATSTKIDNKDYNNVEVDSAIEKPIHVEQSVSRTKVYPATINLLLNICKEDVGVVKEAFKKRNRHKYINIFENYKKNLTDRDYSIINGALNYLYDYSRVASIPKDIAVWMLAIKDIPTSHIISYTSKAVLTEIAKERGLPYSNKKVVALVESIRGVIDSY
jgi:hypothetical protein